MKTTEQERTDIAAIVGRWQVDDLHEAHRALIDEVMKHHRKVIIFVGVSPVLGSQENPLDYPTVTAMIQSHYPTAIVLPIADKPTDQAWSDNLDSLIRQVASKGEVTLYGGRDSFINHYQGKFRTIELDALRHPSGTDVRKQVGRTVRATPDFRAGVIYSSQNRRDRLFTTVDIAVVSKDSEEPRVLLGRKSSHAGWRFPGGFVEISDKNLETAAIRELREETDIETTSLTYMGSYQIPDWRVSEGDAIMTVFFLADKVYGNTGKAGDDLSEIKWFSVSELKEMESSWHPDHIELFKDLITEINEW